MERSASGEKTAYLRLRSGSLAVRDRVVFERPGAEPHRGRLTHLEVVGAEQERDRVLRAGEIGRLRGLPAIRVGDRLGPPGGRTPAFARPSLESLARPVRPEQAGRLHAALSVLADQELGMGELAARLEVGASTVSELVGDLVQVGLVTRRKDPVNRRRVLVRVSREHRDLMRTFMARRARPLLRTFERLPRASGRASPRGWRPGPANCTAADRPARRRLPDARPWHRGARPRRARRASTHRPPERDHGDGTQASAPRTRRTVRPIPGGHGRDRRRPDGRGRRDRLPPDPGLAPLLRPLHPDGGAALRRAAARR
ncbi:MarR family transcriptional regulator [Nocardiopsis sp. FR4]|uniref:MarR family transcriptional regulator n=1 Tax=Nocardiopsis sp. FR4 TaxID=2605985 RepID=UPI001F3B1307|nr:MarR family transcriptional regulator [Nocardiopsis sp. FR4]